MLNLKFKVSYAFSHMTFIQEKESESEKARKIVEKEYM